MMERLNSFLKVIEECSDNKNSNKMIITELSAYFPNKFRGDFQ